MQKITYVDNDGMLNETTLEWLLINKPTINLDLSGILFVSAHNHFTKGVELYAKLQDELQKYDEYKKKKNTIEYYPEFMLRKLGELEYYYEPVVREFSTAKILLVNCAEAFINEVASCQLQGRELLEFDKLSLVGKWLFIPSLFELRKKYFTLDKNPLQGFAKLVKERNKLVHFKGSRNYLQNQELPNFIETFNLTPQACNENIRVTKILIEKLTMAWVGSFGPHWLKVAKDGFRKPCFYLNARNCAMYLSSDRHDIDWKND